MTKVISEQPKPRNRNGKFFCPDCNKSFEKIQGYRMHYMRTHDKTFGKKWKEGTKARAAAVVKTDDANTKGRTLKESVIAILSSATTPMHIQDLITAVRSQGYDGSAKDSHLVNYISQIAADQRNGVVRPRRGYYALGAAQDLPIADEPKPKRARRRRNRNTGTSQEAESPVASVSAEVELELLRRDKTRSDLLAMKLVQVITSMLLGD